MDSSTSFSVPLPPSLPSTGALPSRRLQTQAPPEPPACVQNAMMTKDKKPFTYTPGGIDLSQIKSPRMAKRIARNAQHEGVTNQPKPSPLSQQQPNPGNQNLPAAPMAASALGMPVQVFPTGPPPPPAPPTSSSIPPPPPPMKAQLAPQTNGRDARKSPTPQNFEPPPLGCRPEIKIPANPMATLKKVPKPEPKNDFWVEEYRKDRSKSPMIGDQDSTNEVRQDAPRMPSPPKPYIPAETSDPRMDINRIAFQQQQQPQQQQRPVQHNPPSQQQMYSPHMDVNRMGYQQQQQQQPQQYPVRSPSPPRQQLQQQQRSVPQQQRPASPVRTPVGQYQQQRQPPIANQQRVDSPFRSQDNPNLQRPLSPIKAAQSQPTYYIRQQQQPRQDVTSPPPQQKPAQVGSIYIPPVAPENLALNNNSDQQFRQTPVANQQTPPWLSQRQNLKENADWVREVNATPSARTQTPPITPHQSGSGLRIQMTSTTSSNAKEHIIPIQIEKTPTPTRTPSTPGFGPQPYYTNNQQYGSVPSPGSYNSYPNHQQQQQQQQRVMSPPVQQQLAQSGGVRIVPISMEKQDGPFSPGGVRGPIAQSPTVIQNDPRTLQQQQSWSNGAPNQSKSFRILQKITDTDASGKDSDSEQSSVELQRPQYSRQMGAGNDGSPTDQMRRMQLNDSDQAFVNRGPIQRQTQRYVQQRPVFSQDEQPQQYIHPSEQQVHEPKIYTGSAIPSRSFKILQAMTTPENAGPGQSDL